MTTESAKAPVEQARLLHYAVTTTEDTVGITTKTIASAAGIAPRTKRYALRDEYGVAYEGRAYTHVLAALSRSDITPDLSQRIHTVAYALFKCMTSARMSAISVNRIATYSPYKLCALVARIAAECPETTIGGICDVWLIAHHTKL